MNTVEERKKKVNIAVSTQTFLSGYNKLDGARRLISMGLGKIVEEAQSLQQKYGVQFGLAVEPLTTLTQLGKDMHNGQVADNAASIFALSQPPRSEKDITDLFSGTKGIITEREPGTGLEIRLLATTFLRELARSPIAMAYLATQRYRESNLADVANVQEQMKRVTGVTYDARMHEPIGGETRRDDHDLVRNQVLSMFPQYFREVVLSGQEGLTDGEKVEKLISFIIDNGYKGYSLNLVHLLVGGLFEDNAQAIEHLMQSGVVSMVEVQPNREDFFAVGWESMLPVLEQVLSYDPEVLVLYGGTLQYLGEHLKDIQALNQTTSTYLENV